MEWLQQLHKAQEQQDADLDSLAQLEASLLSQSHRPGVIPLWSTVNSALVPNAEAWLELMTEFVDTFGRLMLRGWGILHAVCSALPFRVPNECVSVSASHLLTLVQRWCFIQLAMHTRSCTPVVGSDPVQWEILELLDKGIRRNGASGWLSFSAIASLRGYCLGSAPRAAFDSTQPYSPEVWCVASLCCAGSEAQQGVDTKSESDAERALSIAETMKESHIGWVSRRGARCATLASIVLAEAKRRRGASLSASRIAKELSESCPSARRYCGVSFAEKGTAGHLLQIMELFGGTIFPSIVEELSCAHPVSLFPSPDDELEAAIDVLQVISSAHGLARGLGLPSHIVEQVHVPVYENRHLRLLLQKHSHSQLPDVAHPQAQHRGSRVGASHADVPTRRQFTRCPSRT